MAFSRENEKDLETIMNTRYAAHLGLRRFHMETRIEKDAGFASVTLRDGEGDFHYPVEARMALVKDSELTPFEALSLLVDYIDLYFEEYFREDENTFLPIDWSTYSFEGYELQMKGQVMNQRLESMGDSLMKANQETQH